MQRLQTEVDFLLTAGMEDIGRDRVDIARREHLVERIGHDRRELSSVRPHAGPQRMLDVVHAPLADAGLGVGRDIGALGREGGFVERLRPTGELLRHVQHAARSARRMAIVAGQQPVDQIVAARDRRLPRRCRRCRQQSYKSHHSEPNHCPPVLARACERYAIHPAAAIDIAGLTVWLDDVGVMSDRQPTNPAASNARRTILIGRKHSPVRPARPAGPWHREATPVVWNAPSRMREPGNVSARSAMPGEGRPARRPCSSYPWPHRRFRRDDFATFRTRPAVAIVVWLAPTTVTCGRSIREGLDVGAGGRDTRSITK